MSFRKRSQYNDSVNTAKQKRRWFQFRLRTLLILVLLVSLLLAWFASELQQAENQREIVEWVRERGGYVLYDYQSRNGKDVLNSLPGRERVREFIGDDLFAEVTVVSLYNTQATDAEMKRLQPLTGLETLDIQATKVTDIGLEHLHKLTNLKIVFLAETRA